YPTDTPAIITLSYTTLFRSGIVAIQIEVEEREAEAAVGERFEGFTDGGCQDGGVPSHAEKGEQMALHPCAAFDNQNTLIFHAVGPPLRAACASANRMPQRERRRSRCICDRSCIERDW